MGGLLGGGPKIDIPAPKPPARMPDAEDPGVVEAKRKAVADSLQRGGRASTILTGKVAAPASTGFDSYANSKLG